MAVNKTLIRASVDFKTRRTVVIVKVDSVEKKRIIESQDQVVNLTEDQVKELETLLSTWI